MALLDQYSPPGALPNEQAYHLIGNIQINYVMQTAVVHLAVNASSKDRDDYKIVKARQEKIQDEIKAATAAYGDILQKHGEASDEVLAAKKSLSDTLFPLQKEMRANKATLERLMPAVRPQEIKIAPTDFPKIVNADGDVTRALVYQYVAATVMKSATNA